MIILTVINKIASFDGDVFIIDSRVGFEFESEGMTPLQAISVLTDGNIYDGATFRVNRSADCKELVIYVN